MHQSSSSIAALAAALAKAQAQLVNPEKSLTATIRAERPEGRERSFRYAPLASGLEIIRKVLGQHEIASVQATAIDGSNGLVKLTTTLAHSSGEWIASEWPVCRMADLATPHRMGAALTYARRYALFTLVGIAGEDDLDAPDLERAVDGPAPFAEPGPPTLASGAGANPAVAQSPSGTLPGNSPRRPQRSTSAPLTLEASMTLRDQLIGELNSLNSADALTGWAQRTLPMKNNLSAADAEKLENAFSDKIANLAAALPSAERTRAQRPDGRALPMEVHIPGVDRTTGASCEPNGNPSPDGKATSEPPPAAYLPQQLSWTAARLASPRLRDKDHLKYVRSQACVICGRSPSDSHHLRFAQHTTLGRKVSDEFTVPLCRLHHRELHRHGNEIKWWKALGVDPLRAARKLWTHTHPALKTAEDTAPAPLLSSDKPDTGSGAAPNSRRGKSSTKRTQSGQRHDIPQAD